MSGMAQRYCSELHREFQNLHAVWEPGNPLKLGDFGVMDGSVFRKKGNIEQKGVSVVIEPDDDSKYFSYKTAASTEVKFYANGEAPVGGTVNGRAKIEILFSNENSIFFNATDCRHDGVKDLEKIGDSLMDLLENDKWDMDYMVVTGILRARATTIVISATSGSSILLEAGANVPTIDLRDANIGLSIKHDNKLSFTAITDAKLVSNGLAFQGCLVGALTQHQLGLRRMKRPERQNPNATQWRINLSFVRSFMRGIDCNLRPLFVINVILERECLDPPLMQN
jgi:hypothetical protein